MKRWSEQKKSGTWAERVVAILAVFAIAMVSLPAAADDNSDASDEEGAEMSADDYAERVQHFYGNTEDFQAAFMQTYTDIAAGQATQSRGRVYFKKPGMMRWDYYQRDSEQRDRMLVSDGSTFYIYEFEYQQVFRQCLEDSQLPTALRFLMGEGELLDEFDVELGGDSTAERPVLELTPKEPTSEYTQLTFVLDPESYQVSKTTLHDPYGNTNQIDFRHSRVNSGLAAEGFEFETPEGARELNPEKECD